MKLLRFGPAMLLALAIAGCSPDTPSEQTTGTTGSTRAGLKELKTIDIKEGKGPAAGDGDLLIVHYTGKFKSGEVFETNTTAGKQPYSLFIGAHAVIPGWEKG